MAIQTHLFSENIGFPQFGSQEMVSMDNGFYQFSFNPQEKSQQQYMQQLQRNQPTLCGDNRVFAPIAFKNNSQQTFGYSQAMAAHAEKQRLEMDEYIRSQNERLRLLLQEQRKQQLAVLVKKIEARAAVLLGRKDEEIAKAVNRAMELENLLRKLEMENQAWQKVAQEYAAMVVSLNEQMEQMRDQISSCFNNGAEDAESCCEANVEESRGVSSNGKKEEGRRMVCRACNSRELCVLFLPCRHLCTCRFCEAILDSCPVCNTPKKASIEALIS